MDEHTRTPAAPASRPASASAEAGVERQQPLPFDDEADEPVPYALTARARREVAPDDLPDLAVVRPRPAVQGPGLRRRHAPDGGDGEGGLEEPGDTRPSRARALRRAGQSPAAIAGQLGVEELTVRAWLGDLARAPGRALPVALVPEPAAAGDVSVLHRRARERARTRARDLLAEDPVFAAGLGVVAGAAEVDEHGIGLTTADPRLARILVSWLHTYGDLPLGRVRLVLRLGPAVAADRARHRWADILGVEMGQLSHTRSSGLADDQGEQAVLHVTDAALAGWAAGCAEALLAPTAPVSAGAAF